MEWLMLNFTLPKELPASVIAGLLWSQFGPTVPFFFGAAMSLLAAGVLLLFMKDVQPTLNRYNQ